MNTRLLEVLVCPLTKGRLEYDAQRSELVSRGAGLAFPVRDGIPIMLVEQARKLEPQDNASQH
ncbi:Trm112 family protein [Kerstersia similis]|uniref:Trm112 family protein n=1 Tax=Kerstersia similis TaxID=206505 RepID=UPI0039F07359